MKAKTFRGVGSLCFLMVFVKLDIAQTSMSDEALVGLWGVEQNLGPLVRGELTLDARGTDWRARISGYDVPVEHRRDEISFKVPGGAGEFRAHFVDPKSVMGHWIQPANAVYNNPYASPVVLSNTEKDVWHGEVVPLAQWLSFYVSIQHASNGSLTAFIRNPEFNLLRRKIYHVVLRNDVLTLSQNGSELHGSYDQKTDTITLPLVDSKPPLVLSRRRSHDAIGFYPRVLPGDYVYHRPLQSTDGWLTASLAEVGLKQEPLMQLIRQILEANLEQNPLPIHSLLIARHGKLALEEYFYGYSSEQPHDTRSAGKTWATMLVGVARQRGLNIGPETMVYPLLSQYKPFAHWDNRKAKLTLRDLMTMTSGFACDDSNENSPGQEDRMQSQTEQPDWYKYTLDLPMAREPGGDKAVYCSADINLVGAVVHEVTGQWLPDLFQQDFAQPLQITEYHLNLMPTGEA